MADANGTPISLFVVALQPDGVIAVELNAWLAVFVIAVFVLAISLMRIWSRYILKDYEIDEAELGVGNGIIRLKPNRTDRQVAYSIWVELSTRKIGLPIEFDHDVIVEVYDSWHTFFSVTRELVKSIPVSKVRNDSTKKVIRLSIEVLNEGLRPHLTKWQARFRHWYNNEMAKNEDGLIDPQAVQRKFPKWKELTEEMALVNQRLIQYRHKMHDLMGGK